jgi:hypothetical protein
MGLGAMALGMLTGCPGSIDVPDLTTGVVATDTINPQTTIDPSDDGEQRVNGEFGELCESDQQCRDRACVSLFDLGFYIPPTFTTGQLPGDEPFDTDGGLPPGVDIPEQEDYYLGICSRECATLFECPETGWTCDLQVGACVPEQLPPGLY